MFYTDRFVGVGGEGKGVGGSSGCGSGGGAGGFSGSGCTGGGYEEDSDVDKASELPNSYHGFPWGPDQWVTLK